MELFEAENIGYKSYKAGNRTADPLKDELFLKEINQSKNSKNTTLLIAWTRGFRHAEHAETKPQ